jgi:hypothetical protein
MTEWMVEHWFIEAILTIVASLGLAVFLCKLVDYWDQN